MSQIRKAIVLYDVNSLLVKILRLSVLIKISSIADSPNQGFNMVFLQMHYDLCGDWGFYDELWQRHIVYFCQELSKILQIYLTV